MSMMSFTKTTKIDIGSLQKVGAKLLEKANSHTTRVTGANQEKINRIRWESGYNVFL